ncbi:MAG: TIR domain-containing protein, partial [Thiomargarita sp.]|nr:TIR domain-containing protein [Thiomargarita sp.]
DWYDRKIIPGQDFQDDIDNNLENADIICLFISASFLSSPACIEEKRKALELKKKKGIAVVPIILVACGWLDDSDISSLLALPNDGSPISNFTDSNKAWNDVYNGLKEVINKEIKIKQLSITKQFSAFLQNTELLAKAHSQKGEVLLEDIFIYPELAKYDDLREYEKKVNSESIIEDFYDYSRILIAGENQSGKTTLCKKIFTELHKKNFIPIYIFDKSNQYQGKIENKILNAYKEQYETISIGEIDRQRIVPIIDDFHFAKNKVKHIQNLSTYHHQIIVVDDIFSLNFKDENLINSFTHFRIEEFNPSLRNQLIEKWTHLTDKKNGFNNKNTIYQKIDEKTELVDRTLGKIFGNGIMPAYPFFILSIISTYEVFARPLDQEITSQGYCYQALIYMYLRKQGVKNNKIDTYINFLTEFAFFFYSIQKNEISKNEFNHFIEKYLGHYNLPVKQETLLERLMATRLVAFDSFGNYSFGYKYLYYFFVAKYLAENITEQKETINKIIANLHTDENAYIAIFISHHTKSDYLLDEIISNSLVLFEQHEPATLSKNEMSFFDIQADVIANAALPSAPPETERNNRLSVQNNIENNNQIEKTEKDQENDNEIEVGVRRSIRTVEVMGQVIKNRAGSLGREKLERIFAEAMNVHLRVLASFFAYIQNEDEQQEIVRFISERLEFAVAKKSEERRKKGKKERRFSKDELEEISKTIFWNTNFFITYGLINKIISSIGSNQLIQITEKVCDEIDTPASHLIKHGILMWYAKNLQVDSIAKKLDGGDFSDVAKKMMKYQVVNYCSMHKVGFKEKQRIENKFGISRTKMLTLQAQKDN